MFTGRRKSAIAQVQLTEGSGEFVINGQPAPVYLQGNALALASVEAPLRVVKMQKKYGIIVNVEGGGLTGQAQAIRLGIARALSVLKDSYRASLKEKGSLNARCSL